MTGDSEDWDTLVAFGELRGCGSARDRERREPTKNLTVALCLNLKPGLTGDQKDGKSVGVRGSMVGFGVDGA